MQYSISDLEQLSGISAHNIRIWERRYNALQPSRSVGNTRFYNDNQLKRLLNIASLYFSGHKISKACAMSKEETESFLQQEINATVSRENQYEYFISQIISKAMGYEEHEVNQLITQSFDRNGILNTYKYVMYPLLVRLGLMWCQESLCPSQEHFLSSVFRQKLYTAIDSCPPPKQGSQKWLLFLPEDEDHEIGLLLANYLLRTAGKQVIYLGAKVPLFALKNTIVSTAPEKVLFFMTRLRPVTDAQKYLADITDHFPDQQFYFSGNPKVLGELNFKEDVCWLRTLADFEIILNSES
jgi:MerR family transcriptional regulator, light-induced transcriptional regulator